MSIEQIHVGDLKATSTPIYYTIAVKSDPPTQRDIMRFDQDAKDAWSVKLQGLESSFEAGKLLQCRAGGLASLQRPLGESEFFIFRVF